jgi:hypothetical protein
LFPSAMRGAERRVALKVDSAPIKRGAPCDKALALRGAPLRRLQTSGPCFRTARGASIPALKTAHRRPSGCPVGGAFASRSAASSSHRRQPLLVGADGDPRLPSAGCEPARGRRARLGWSVAGPPNPRGALSRISGQGPVPGCSTSGSPHEASPREQAG